jgi:hypothetical protein
MWIKQIDSSEVTADILAAMKNDGLIVHDANPGEHIITLTTDSTWLANKWEMSQQADLAPPKKTFLDRLAGIGAWTFIVLCVVAVLAFQWLFWRNSR